MTFSAEWLSLREPADARARSQSLAHAVAARTTTVHRGEAQPISILDLATGTGANVRYLGRFFREAVRWTLVDYDEALLGVLLERMAAWADARGDTLSVVPADLQALEAAAVFGECDLITASALLDLVSESWLCRLAVRCRETRAPILFALTYDGRIECSPEDPGDAIVRDLVNRHQQTDKGFGPAAGPYAVDIAARLFAAAGYEVRRERSDWQLGHDEEELQRRLVEGWAAAAQAIMPAQSREIEEWLKRRRGHISARRSAIRVGHQDLAAWL